MPALSVRTTSSMEPPPDVTAHPMDTTPIPVDLIATASICLFLTTSAICARIFTKAFDLRHVQVEDYAIIFSGAGFASFVGVLFAAASAGQGAHLWNVSEEALKRVYLLSNILAIIYAPAMFSAKFAVLLQIGHIFSGVQKNFVYWAVRILIALNALSYTVIFFVRIFACMPRAKISDPSVPGKCISQNGSIIGTGAINVASDITILLLPLYAVSKLQLPLRRKLLLAGVFGVGLLACVASVCRLFYSVKLNKDPDFTKAIWPVNMWALAEFTCVILVACFPTLPRLVQYIQGKTAKRDSYPTHAKWISTTSSRGETSDSSKTQIFYPAETQLSLSKEGSVNESAPKISTDSVPLPDRYVSPVEPSVPFEPYERPISHLSCDSYTTAAMDEMLSSPVSPMTTTCPSPQLHSATKISVTPIRLATIRKTVDVRISNHTNPGSPFRLNRPEAMW